MNDREKLNNKQEDINNSIPEQKGESSNLEGEKSNDKAVDTENNIPEQEGEFSKFGHIGPTDNEEFYNEVGKFDSKESKKTEPNEKEENGTTNEDSKKDENKEFPNSKENIHEISVKENTEIFRIKMIAIEETKEEKDNHKNIKFEVLKPQETKKEEIKTPQIKNNLIAINEKNIEKKYISPSSSEKELNEKMSLFKNENFDKND